MHAAAKRRAALKTAASAGLCQAADPGSDSGASTSTAASRTPVKPKAQLSKEVQEGATATPAAVNKRTRAKTTPVPASDKTPSTSTPLPKSLKHMESSPNGATPMKTGEPLSVAKKALEFEGAPYAAHIL